MASWNTLVAIEIDTSDNLETFQKWLNNINNLQKQ
jgi:hypothetical protein